MAGHHRDGEVKSTETVNSEETVLASKQLQDGDMSKRRQLPLGCSRSDLSQDIPGVQPGSTYECATDDSDSGDPETAELGHDDDITGRKHVTEYFIHPVTSMFVYMRSETGGAPYLCEDCDYKTTVNYMFLDHMNLHYTYSDSDSDNSE